MTNRTRIFAALSLLAALSGCGSQDPREVLVGTWGADLTIVEQEGAKLSEPMAARMHKLKLDAMRGMRMTIGGGGAVQLTGTPTDAVGTYSVDAVDGDTLTVTITYDGRAPETSMFQVLGSDRVVMTNVGKTVTIPLLRK